MRVNIVYSVLIKTVLIFVLSSTSSGGLHIDLPSRVFALYVDLVICCGAGRCGVRHRYGAPGL